MKQKFKYFTKKNCNNNYSLLKFVHTFNNYEFYFFIFNIKFTAQKHFSDKICQIDMKFFLLTVNLHTAKTKLPECMLHGQKSV